MCVPDGGIAVFGSDAIGQRGWLEVLLEFWWELQEWVCGGSLGAVFVLSFLIQMAFGCGDGVWLIGFEVVQGESGDAVDVFVLQSFEHGAWYG